MSRSSNWANWPKVPIPAVHTIWSGRQIKIMMTNTLNNVIPEMLLLKGCQSRHQGIDYILPICQRLSQVNTMNQWTLVEIKTSKKNVWFQCSWHVHHFPLAPNSWYHMPHIPKCFIVRNKHYAASDRNFSKYLLSLKQINYQRVFSAKKKFIVVARITKCP